MTAPLRTNEPIKVEVALAERTYDIMIGRGLLASLGERIKTLRQGARTVIVTDENVAKQHLAVAQAALQAAGVETSAIVVPAGEGSKKIAPRPGPAMPRRSPSSASASSTPPRTWWWPTSGRSPTSPPTAPRTSSSA